MVRLYLSLFCLLSQCRYHSAAFCRFFFPPEETVPYVAVNLVYPWEEVCSGFPYIAILNLHPNQCYYKIKSLQQSQIKQYKSFQSSRVLFTLSNNSIKCVKHNVHGKPVKEKYMLLFHTYMEIWVPIIFFLYHTLMKPSWLKKINKLVSS